MMTTMRLMLSPCLSYRVQGLFGDCFQSVHCVLPLTAYVPCHIWPFGVR